MATHYLALSFALTFLGLAFTFACCLTKKAAGAARCNCTACPASKGSSSSSRQFRAIASDSDIS